LLGRARDGIVLPLREHMDEVVLRTRGLSILAEDGQGTSWDPIKVEGEVPADSTNAVEASGAGAEPIKPGAGDPESDAPGAADAVADAQQAVAAAAALPPMHAWSRGAANREVPARDAYALRLVVGRTLYDKGRIVAETPILQRVAQPPGMRVNPAELGRIGVDAGSQVKVTSARGSQVVTIEPDASVPAGLACFAFTADGLGPALLIDASQPVTDLRIESMR
jgi:hypothetical protein